MIDTKSITTAMSLAIAMASATATFARPSDVSDAQYIAASRCAGLMASGALGGGDTHEVDRFLKAQAGGRASEVFDRADEARESASREARHGGPNARAALIAERDGACRALTGASSYAGAAPPVGSSRTN